MKKDPKKALPYRVLRTSIDGEHVEGTARTSIAAEKRARAIRRSEQCRDDDLVEVQRRSASSRVPWVTVARYVFALVVLGLSACGPALQPEVEPDAGAQCGRAGAACCPGAVPCLDGLRCVDLVERGWGMPSGTCATRNENGPGIAPGAAVVGSSSSY